MVLMHVAVNGTRLWFDVDGCSLLPDGPGMHKRPTVVLVHGGPGSYDHSYFKPYFSRLTAYAQVVYLDLRDHGRSRRHDPALWSFDVCADDVRAFCDAVGIERPLVIGHSMGGFVALLYGARHPGHAGALILQSTMARFDIARLVTCFRTVAGPEVAELARRAYGGEPVLEPEWAQVFAAFGPRVPDAHELARRVRNAEVAAVGMEQLRRLDILDQLASIASPTLVCVGEFDPVTPEPAAREIIDGLAPGVGQLEVIDGAGHFPWLDRADYYWAVVASFLQRTMGGSDSLARGLLPL
jgi:proline iminopeptidase